MDMFKSLSKKKKEIQDGNKLKKFFADGEKITNQFKALHGYGSSVSQEERKEFHKRNYRRAFSVCRNALEDYAKRAVISGRGRGKDDDIKRPCEIMEALTRLCQDIPHLVKQNWNHNALSELFTKFLNFNTNQEIRLQCIPFIFVVIDAAKQSAHKKYIENLKYAADFTPFCIQVPYENYYNNCKKNLIVAQEPLPWIRTGPTNKAHCIAILSSILALIRDTSDFDFWYLYVAKHIYPQLYYSCTSSHGLLVQKLFSEEEKHELDKPDNVEKEGFGRCGPPPQIQSLFSDWMDVLLMKQSQRKVILGRKIYILYLLEMIRNTMKLPVTRTSTIFAMLKHVERWILGFNISNAFKEDVQMYLQMIIQHLFFLFDIENMDLPTDKLNRKLNLASYGIYILRLIVSEPVIKLAPATWKCLFYALLKQTKVRLTDKIQHKSIDERLIHPLIHCLFQSLIWMSVADPKTANALLTEFKFKVDVLIQHRVFVIEWREIMRNLTVDLLKLISSKTKSDGKNDEFVIPNQDLDLDSRWNMDSDGYYFVIEHRLAQLKLGRVDFGGLDGAFIIYDRLLHILGAPSQNGYSRTRVIHLEGFCDSLKIFIAALGIKERGRARKQKMKLKNTQKKEALIKPKRPLKEKHNPNPHNIDGAVYGFPHSSIGVPIDIGDIALSGNLPDTLRDALPLPPREQLPQSDTLIAIFGAWLFEHCLALLLKCSLTQQVERLNEFRLSFCGLSSIFLTHCESSFDDIYLATYYRIIKLSFGPKVSQKIRSIVIHECAKGCIFGKNLNGVNCLIPDFLDTMTRIIGFDPKAKHDYNQIHKNTLMEQEALDALNITMSLICFAAHFDDLWINSFPVHDNDSSNRNNKQEDTTFRSIKLTIAHVFAYIARNDNLPIHIINTVIWGSVLIIYDEVSSSKDVHIISTAIRSIVDGTNINKLNMAGIATRAIESLSPICNQICAVNSDLIIRNLFEPFLQNTLEYVQKAGDKDLQQRAEICKICTHQLYCCLEWMFRFPPSVLRNDALLSLYFKVIHQTLCLQAKLPSKRSLHQNVTDKHPLADLVLAAQTSKMMLFHYLGNFPLVHDSGAISSNASDDYKGSQEGNVFLSYDSNVLITANDRILAHQAGPEPGVRFLLRDESGKFAWNFTPCSIQAKPTNPKNIKMETHQQEDEEEAEEDDAAEPVADINKKTQIIQPTLRVQVEKRQPPPTQPSPPPPNENETNSFNETLSSITEKHANVYNKRHFKMGAFKEDGLKQVLNYVTRELTPPAGKIYKNKNRKMTTSHNTNQSNKNDIQGSFPSGHLSDKSRKKLAKYMDDQKREEADLYCEYEEVRRDKINKMKKLQSALAEEQENKCAGALSDRKIREAVTGFDCSRFLLGHFGILTPGPVLGLKDSLFSDVSSEDIDNAKSPKSSQARHPNQRRQELFVDPHHARHTMSRHASFAVHTKMKQRSSGKQYRLDPYLYSLDCNLLAMFGNKDNAFHRRLRLLDQGSFEREKHKIGVVYVGPDQDDQKPILANESGSTAYVQFIENLGWTVDLLQHQGFNGAMNASTTGRYAKYYNTATYEMAFHIATKMPTNYNDEQQMEKKKHIGNDQVNIIWTDHGREYLVDTIHSDFNQVQIVIYPLNNGLFRIKIHKKSSVGYFGPLLNNMIIRQHMLSVLVRITSLYANRTVRYAASVYTRPFVERKKYLDEAICKNSHKSHESILGAFFPYMT